MSTLFFLFAIAAALFEGRLLAWMVFGGPEGHLADRVLLWAASALGFFLLVPLYVAFVAGVSPGWFAAAHAVLMVVLAVGAARTGLARNPEAWVRDALFGGGWLREWLDAMRVAPCGAKALWALAVCCWVALGVPGGFLPPRAFDAVDYHVLQQAAQWRGDGAFHFVLTAGERADPLMARGQTTPNAKMMFGLQLAEVRGSWRGVGMVQWLFLGVWLLTAWALARRMELPAWCGAAGAVFLVTIPEAMLQATESYADVQAAAGAGLIVWALLALKMSERPERWIVPAALGVGHFVGAKLSMLPAAGGLGILALVLAVQRSTTLRAKLPLRLVASSMVAGVLFAGPWIATGIFLYGNPIYPYKFVLLGTELLPGVLGTEATAGALANATGVHVPGAYWYNAMESSGVTLLSGWLSGIGPQWTVLGLPAFAAMLLAGWRQEDRRWRLPVMIGAVVFFLSPHLWYARFALQLGSLLALAFGRTLSRAPSWLRAGLMAVLLACAAWNAFRVIPSWQYRPRTPVLAAYPVVTGDVAPVLLDRFPGEFTARDYARDVLAVRDATRLAFSVPNLTATRLVSDELRLRAEPVAPPEDGADPRAWLDGLRARGFTHLLAPADALEDEPLFADQPFSSENAWGPVAPPREAIWELIPNSGGTR
ncbi:MAG: hypothetical protein PWP23_2946 [Candidatus Sumerlaeota bacterium]|nr:hypothetical protein [Candidatus Sumerlaeota bacterium]